MSNMPMPSYSPGASEQIKLAKPERPQPMQVVFWLLLAAAACHIIAMLFSAVYILSDKFRESTAADIAKSNFPANGQDQVQLNIIGTLVILIVVAVVAVALYVLIGLFIRKGAGWARIVGTILAALSLGQLMGLTMPAGIFSILQVIAGLVAITFCYIAPGSTYFKEMKDYRVAHKTR